MYLAHLHEKGAISCLELILVLCSIKTWAEAFQKHRCILIEKELLQPYMKVKEGKFGGKMGSG